MGAAMFGWSLKHDWKDSWRWISARFIAANIALQTTFLAFPEVLRQYLPDYVTRDIAIFLLVATYVGTLLRQPTSRDNDHGPDSQ